MQYVKHFRYRGDDFSGTGMRGLLFGIKKIIIFDGFNLCISRGDIPVTDKIIRYG
jgi:hypothetical protein